MIKPSSDDYYVTTDVVHEGGLLSWTWQAALRQPPPWRPYDLDHDYGWCWTEKRARRKAERAGRRMMRAANSWTSRTYTCEEWRP